MPSVTVLVPIYNVESYLRQCLDSLKTQTLQDVEFLCVDDGSTDASGKIADAYAAEDARFRVIHKANEGYGKTMNRGLAEARGEYIGIVESDDFADAVMFETLHAAICSTGADVVKSNFYQYDEARGSVPTDLLAGCPYHEMCSAVTVPKLLQTDLFIWTSLYRKSFLEAKGICFRETPGAAYQDVGFSQKVTASCQKMYLLPDHFLHYRIDNAGSSVHSIGKKAYCYNDEFMSYWVFLRQRSIEERTAGAAAAPNMFRIYRQGVWPYVASQERYRYLRRAWEDFHQLQEEGFLIESFWKAEDWIALMKFLQHREERITTICAEKQRGQFLREGLLTFLRSAETVYLYGAGCVAEQMLKILQKEAISIKSILVGDPRKNPKCVHSISVHGYAEVSKEAKDAVVLLALTPRKMNVQQEVFKNLQETGYRNVIVLTEELRQALAGA